MTRSTIEKHLQTLLFVNKQAKGKDVDSLIGSAISMGYEDFWGAYPWAFKETHDTVTTTASTETVELPDDFDGIVSAVEHETTDGRKLRKLSPDEYDRLIPYSEDLTTDTPAYYKVYYDREDEVWKLALYPTPDSAISLYITYHTIENGGEVPGKYIGGLYASIGKYITMFGTKERQAAIMEANAEIERLKIIDGPNADGTIGRFLDAWEAEGPRSKRWYEEG